jgi:hypothetical protein
MSDWYWAQGDTATAMPDVLRDAAGDPVDIAGATIELTLTPLRGGAPIVSGAGNAENDQVGNGSDGSKGAVHYDPQAGDTDAPGDYLGQWTATFAGGAVLSFPNAGYLLVTVTPDAPLTAPDYLTREELKKTLKLSSETFANADIDIAITAAARGLEAVFNNGQPWALGPNGEARYFTLRHGIPTVKLRQAQAVTEVALDSAGQGNYGALVAGTDYRLEPTDGPPYTQLRMLRSGALWGLEYDPRTVVYPFGLDAVRVTGRFGWDETPAGVKSAATIVATRLMRRAREAPFGIVGLGIDGSTVRATQIARDPDIALAMSAPRAPRRLLT